MIRRGAVVAALAAAAILLTAAPVAAAELVTMPSGATSATLPAEKDAVVVFPFTPVDAAIELSSVTLVSMRRDGRPVSSLQEQAVDVEIVDEALKIDVDVDALPRTGTYTLTLRLIARTAGQQLVELTLERPSAVVTTPSTIVVEREIWFPELHHVCPFGCDDEQPDLRVTAGDDTRITSLSAVGTDGDGDVTVRIDGYDSPEPLELPTPLVSRGSLSLPYDLDGDIPLGTVARSVTIASPQLAEPATVTVQVVTRRHPALILGFILFGLLLGFLIRKVLVRVQDAAGFTAARRDLRDRLVAVRVAYSDPELRAAIDGALQQIARLSRWKATESSEGLAKVEREVNTALEELQASLAETTERIGGYEAALGASWSLPDATRQALAGARPLLAAARAALDARRTADTELAALDHHVESNVEPAIAQDADSLAAPLEELRSAANVWESSFGNVAAVAARAVARLEPTKPEEGAEDTGGARLERALRRLGRATSEIALLDDAAALAARLVMARLPDDVARDAIAEARAQLRAAARPADPAGTVVAMTAAISAFRKAIVDAFVDATEASHEDAVRTALATGDIDAATRALAASHGRTVLGSQNAVDESAPPPTPAEPLDRELVAPTVAAPIVDRVVSGVVRFSAQTIGGLATVIRYVVLALLTAVVAYGWFESDWTGDLQDFVQIVAWAFALDLTVEGLQQLVTTKPAVLKA